MTPRSVLAGHTKYRHKKTGEVVTLVETRYGRYTQRVLQNSKGEQTVVDNPIFLREYVWYEGDGK